MPSLRPQAAAVLAAALVAAAAAVAVDHGAPFPAAEVARGGEDAFVEGLQPRELVPRQGPRRWTGERIRVRFRHLPPGPATLEVAVHGQRGPVTVAAGGVLLGVLQPEAPPSRYALTVGGGSLDVDMRAATFTTADGRRLGALLDRVGLEHAAPAGPGAGLLLAFLLPALAIVGFGLWSGMPAWGASALAAAVTAAQAWLLWPQGLVRSGYTVVLAGELLAAAALSALVAAWLGRWGAEVRAWALPALMAAVLVQGVLATAPLMIVSDAVFHANKLAVVAHGDLFPTSVTQHARPFRIPYPVSFYLPLVPLAWAGVDRVLLVRAGAAVAGLLASGAVFALVALYRPAAQAALAVVLLQLSPGVFDVYSYGNFSNAFGQAATVVFFAWWAGRTPGGAAVGALALALAGTAHLSSFLVLWPLALALVLARRRELAGDRTRWMALALGLGLAALYYLRFAPLILQQLPRLAEGGGGGGSAPLAAGGGLLVQAVRALGQWGAPATVLALVGLVAGRHSGLGRDLLAFAAAGALLVVPAVVSPLEVRYLYALTLPVSLAAAEGACALGRRGLAGRVGAVGLVAWQAWVAWQGIVQAVLDRYR